MRHYSFKLSFIIRFCRNYLSKNFAGYFFILLYATTLTENFNIIFGWFSWTLSTISNKNNRSSWGMFLATECECHIWVCNTLMVLGTQYFLDSVGKNYDKLTYLNIYKLCNCQGFWLCKSQFRVPKCKGYAILAISCTIFESSLPPKVISANVAKRKVAKSLPITFEVAGASLAIKKSC